MRNEGMREAWGVLKLKWDETTQKVLWREQRNGAVLTDWMPLLVSICVRRMALLTSAMRRASPLVMFLPLLVLSSTKAPGLFAALMRDSPAHAGSDVSVAFQWMVLIFVIDGATANIRLTKWQVTIRAPRTLVITIVCLQHTIHNLTLPATKALKLTSDLFRAAKVFQWNSYILDASNRLATGVARKLRIVRHIDSDPAAHAKNIKLMEFLFCGGNELDSTARQRQCVR